MRGGFGWLGLLGALLIALIAGGIGYWIGVSSDAVPVAAGTVTYGWGWGFPFFGLLFGFLFILLIIAIARRAWGGPGWYGRGWYGPGSYAGHEHAGRTVPPQFEPMLEDWHRKAHGEPAPAKPGTDQA
jgi:hypothetical protein